jgi:hypothetical protein
MDKPPLKLDASDLLLFSEEEKPATQTDSDAQVFVTNVNLSNESANAEFPQTNEQPRIAETIEKPPNIPSISTQASVESLSAAIPIQIDVSSPAEASSAITEGTIATNISSTTSASPATRLQRMNPIPPPV